MTPAKVEQFLHRLNDAWLAQDYVGLSTLYDPEAVLLPPDLGEPIKGVDAISAAYKDFHAACDVRSFEINRHSSWAYNSQELAHAVMVHMHFMIDYQLKGAEDSVTEDGLEIYTLVPNSDNQPRIVWRAQFAL